MVILNAVSQADGKSVEQALAEIIDKPDKDVDPALLCARRMRKVASSLADQGLKEKLYIVVKSCLPTVELIEVYRRSDSDRACMRRIGIPDTANKPRRPYFLQDLVHMGGVQYSPLVKNASDCMQPRCRCPSFLFRDTS